MPAFPEGAGARWFCPVCHQAAVWPRAHQGTQTSSRPTLRCVPAGHSVQVELSALYSVPVCTGGEARVSVMLHAPGLLAMQVQQQRKLSA